MQVNEEEQIAVIKVPSKDTAVVVAALSKLAATLRRSLTWDRGLEMAKHKALRLLPMCINAPEKP